MKLFHKNNFYFASIGTLRITCDEKQIHSIHLIQDSDENKDNNMDSKIRCALCQKAADELSEYLAGQRSSFDLPVDFTGSKLQSSVWNYLRKIPYGQTVSYTQVAEGVGCRSVRAVATAVGQNPLPLLIPCHRVIRKDGSIGEFSMGGPQVKSDGYHN